MANSSWGIEMGCEFPLPRARETVEIAYSLCEFEQFGVVVSDRDTLGVSVRGVSAGPSHSSHVTATGSGKGGKAAAHLAICEKTSSISLPSTSTK